MKERNAAELTLYLVIGLICTPTAFGFTALPKSLAEGAPATLAQIMVIVLWFGCFGAIAGMLWRDRIDGEAIQQVALIAVFAGAVSYALALVASSLADLSRAILAVGFITGVGLGALARYGQLRGWPLRFLTFVRERHDKGL